jgi:putative autotransporter adhesin-like protein
MMKFSPIALAGAGFLVLAAPAIAGDSRTYDLQEFDRISVSAGVVVIAEVGSPQTVLVETDRGDFSDFEIKVDGRKLKVSRKWNRLAWHGNKSDYKVMISVRDLNSVEASSGSKAKITNIDTQKLSIDLSSGARVFLQGACEECTVDLSSGADLDAKDLTCDDARIDVSSGGHGEMNVTRSVVADASSGGHVVIFGNPERVNIDKSSGGRIKIKSSAQASRD